ncbi:YegP family protein [Pseudoxanthomonas winnipegensis]|uniref:YegP family protein n=1 Tax=Pseudoxanthomonas winnipegensis TaxID=2480810 RepID=UPI003F836BCA
MYFKLYKDNSGYWRWTLYASNGRKIADSGEGYNSKSDAQNGIDLVRSTNSSTPVRE